MEDLEFRLLAIIGNAFDDELYAGVFDEMADVVKQLYNKMDRALLANPFLAPKTVHYGGKVDMLNLQKWVFQQWTEGKVCTGFIHVGAKWGSVFWLPLSAFTKNVISIRSACYPPCTCICIPCTVHANLGK